MNKSQLFKQLHELGKTAESQRATIETNRLLPEALVDQLKDTGAFRLWVAREFGGSQAHILELMEAVQILSYYNGSLGWVLGVTATEGLGSGYMQEEAAKEIYSNPRSMAGGWAAPAGRAQKVDGGILVSGKWSWGSGIRHCTHIVGGVLLSIDGQEKPISALAYMPPEKVTFIDNWDVLGLKGTHSIDYEVDNLFVPDGKWIYFPVRQARIDDTLYRFSFLGALACGVASVAIGLAQRALDEIIRLCTEKVPNGARRTLAERPVVHEKNDTLQATYQATKLCMENAVHKNWEEAENKNIQVKTKSELRLATTYAVSQAVEVVQQAYRIGGGSSIWNGVKLEELLRDVNMVSQHGMVSLNNYEIAGRVTFGMKVNEWLL